MVMAAVHKGIRVVHMARLSYRMVITILRHLDGGVDQARPPTLSMLCPIPLCVPGSEGEADRVARALERAPGQVFPNQLALPRHRPSLLQQLLQIN